MDRQRVDDIVQSLLAEGATFQSGDLALRTGLTRQGVQRHLHRLVEEGVLLPEGAGRGACYRGVAGAVPPAAEAPGESPGEDDGTEGARESDSRRWDVARKPKAGSKAAGSAKDTTKPQEPVKAAAPAPAPAAAKAKPPAAPAASKAVPAPTHEAIAARARAIWESRGRPQGQDLDIWVEAERGLRS